MTNPADDQYLALWRRWWLNTERRSEETPAHYDREIRQLQDHADGTPLIDLDALVVEDWIGRRLESSSHNGRFAYRAARSLYRWALARDLVDIDPTDRIPAPREQKNPTPTTVTADMVDTVLSAIDGTHPGSASNWQAARLQPPHA